MTCTVTVLPAGRKLSAQPGENLLTLLRSANLAPEAPCGGNGKCGKCTVLIGGKPVLACGYTVSGDVTVHVTAAKTHARILTDGYGAEVEPQPLRDGAMAAFDIGTTTVVCYLLEAGTGHLLAAASAVNPQQSYGADVISRIQRALAGEMEAQTRLIREQMGSLLGDACRQAGVLPETVGVISVVGNPCMQQLFLGIMPENLAKIPFAPVLTKAEVGEAGDIFPCCPRAALVTVPDISGYVGADTVGCVLASGLDREEKRTLLVDIGTNGEMVLGNRERMIACATAAGPALEGAKIRFGMRGEPPLLSSAVSAHDNEVDKLDQRSAFLLIRHFLPVKAQRKMELFHQRVDTGFKFAYIYCFVHNFSFTRIPARNHKPPSDFPDLRRCGRSPSYPDRT